MSNTLKFKYKFKEDYNPEYINGSYGGVNLKGEIIVNFFLERNPIPYSQTISLDENDVKTEPEDIDNSLVRFVSTGIVMNHQTAKVIHAWLGKHIKTLEEELEEKKNDGSDNN